MYISIFQLNFDSDNAEHSDLTFQQTRPGPLGGLEISASLSTDEFPMLESDADNGFKIYVNAVPVGLLLSPVTAPHGSTTHVQVKPRKRYLAKTCAPHGHLLKMDLVPYHDPEGIAECLQGLLSLFKKFEPCLLPVYGMKPNSSAICSPHMVYMISNAVALDFRQQYEAAKGSLQNTFLVSSSVTLCLQQHLIGLCFRNACPRV